MIITVVDLGRVITDREMAAKNSYIESQVAVNATNGQVAQMTGSNSGVRVWSTVESATAFVDWSNSNYNPPPVKAIVQVV